MVRLLLMSCVALLLSIEPASGQDRSPTWGWDPDTDGCWGCLNYVLDDGYACEGTNYSHVAGGEMGGWYGYRASHRQEYCGSCIDMHSTCLWGEDGAFLEIDSGVRLALEANRPEAIRAVFATHRRNLELTERYLTIVSCDRDVLAFFPLATEQLLALIEA